MKIVAKALVKNPQGKLLLLYRGASHPNFPGHLDLPGGEIEKGEEWLDAVVREISEETGVAIKGDRLKKVFEKQYPEVTHVLYVANTDANMTDISLSWEHASYQWFTKKELLEKNMPIGVDRYYLDVINYLKSN